MRPIPIFFLLSIILSGACSYEKSDGSEIRELSLAPKESVVSKTDLTDYLSISEITILKSHPQYPIGDINKLIVKDSSLFIMDRIQTRALYEYDLKGKFTSMGKGAGEVNYIRDFDVNPVDGSILIASAKPNKVLKYSNSGSLESEYALSFRSRHIAYLSEESILCEASPVKSKEYFLWLKNGDVYARAIDIASSKYEGSNTSRVVDHGGFKRSNGYIYSIPTMSNVLYEIDGDDIREKFVLNIGDHTPSYDKYYEGDVNIVEMLSFYQFDQHLLVSYLLDDAVYMYLFNKDSHENVLGRLYGVMSPVAPLAMIFFNTIYAEGNVFWAQLSSTHVEYWKKMIKKHPKEASIIFKDIGEAAAAVRIDQCIFV